MLYYPFEGLCITQLDKNLHKAKLATSCIALITALVYHGYFLTLFFMKGWVMIKCALHFVLLYCAFRPDTYEIKLQKNLKYIVSVRKPQEETISLNDQALVHTSQRISKLRYRI